MKDKNKKVPKNQENDYIVSSTAEAVLYGLLFSLLGIIGLLNKGIVGSFITYCIVYLFGAFYILFFLFLIFFGLYLIIKKRFYKLQIDLKLLGFLLMLLAFTIGASVSDDLRFNNFYNEFAANLNTIKSGQFSIESMAQVPYVGGGIIGYALSGLLNSAVTPLGTRIIVIFFLVVGFILVFKGLIIYCFKHLVSFHKKRKEMRKNQSKKELISKDNEDNSQIDKKEIQENKEDVKKQDDIVLTREEDIHPSSLVKDENNLEEEEISFKEDPVIKNDTRPFFDDDEIVNHQVKQDTEITKNPSLLIEEVQKEENKNVVNKVNTHVNEEKKNDVNSNVTYVKLFNEEKKNVGITRSKTEYIYPPISLLSDYTEGDKTQLNMAIADDYTARINQLFAEFGIGAQVISYTIGPSVTRFDVKTNPGVKISSIARYQEDLQARLDGNKTVRVELIVEGKDTSSIEVGNKYPSSVSFKEVISNLALNPKDKLLIPLGKNISGEVVKTSIDELPHLLVAGTTGSGKSVFIHSIIMTLIMRNSPDELRLLLIDPKKVEFSKYHDLPHLLCPIVKEADEATVALKRLVEEMERRYEVFETKGNGASKYSEYMEYAKEHNLELMPIIVVIVDEFADLILQAQKDVETAIQRIGQKARACGIHLILATQRPSVQFVTGDIKGNIPSRVALSVASNTDSRVILDDVGAETLMGRGDLLARIPNSKALVRVQSPYAQNKDIMSVCDFIRAHGEVHYYEPFLNLKEKINTNEGSILSTARRTDLDPLHDEVKKYVLETNVASTSKIQNAFQVGFSRADYILDCLEKEGIVKRLPNGRRVVIGSMDDNDAK